MPTDRLTVILGALTALYALYIAIALSWGRLRDALCNRRRREMSLLRFNAANAPRKRALRGHPYTKLR
jgi:hypothetical protein